MLPVIDVTLMGSRSYESLLLAIYFIGISLNYSGLGNIPDLSSHFSSKSVSENVAIGGSGNAKKSKGVRRLPGKNKSRTRAKDTVVTGD